MKAGSSEKFSLRSHQVNQTYEIHVVLPESYHVRPSQTYPVVYVLDGNWVFGIATDTVKLLGLDKKQQEFILVGVGYPDVSIYGSIMGLRTRDFTPGISDSAEFQGGGGAADFLLFLAEELLPAISSKYRAAPGQNTLVGYSFGGVFALYALFHLAPLFRHYLICSPSVWWAGEVLFEYERTYAEHHPDLKAGVFLAVGGDESVHMVHGMERMAVTLEQRLYPSLKLSSHVFEGEHHYSVFPAFFSRGIRGI